MLNFWTLRESLALKGKFLSSGLISIATSPLPLLRPYVQVSLKTRRNWNSGDSSSYSARILPIPSEPVRKKRGMLEIIFKAWPTRCKPRLCYKTSKNASYVRISSVHAVKSTRSTNKRSVSCVKTSKSYANKTRG